MEAAPKEEKAPESGPRPVEEDVDVSEFDEEPDAVDVDVSEFDEEPNAVDVDVSEFDEEPDAVDVDVSEFDTGMVPKPLTAEQMTTSPEKVKEYAESRMMGIGEANTYVNAEKLWDEYSPKFNATLADKPQLIQSISSAVEKYNVQKADPTAEFVLLMAKYKELEKAGAEKKANELRRDLLEIATEIGISPSGHLEELAKDKEPVDTDYERAKKLVPHYGRIEEMLNEVGAEDPSSFVKLIGEYLDMKNNAGLEDKAKEVEEKIMSTASELGIENNALLQQAMASKKKSRKAKQEEIG